MRGTCSIDGCEKTVEARGWCPMHYQRWRHNGSPFVVQDRRVVPGVTRRKHSEGYVLICDPSHPLANSAGFVMEHRWVWFNEYRSIPDGWHVHHKNGDKEDNRLENLEAVDPREHGRDHGYEGHAVRWGYRAAAFG